MTSAPSTEIRWNLWYPYSFYQQERWLLLVFIFIAAFPVRDYTVDLKVTLHIPSSPGDLGFVPHYWPCWNPIHPSAQCTNNPLYIQAFFNKPSCETNLLSICPVCKGLKIKFPFWGILSPVDFEIKLHSVFFHLNAETWIYWRHKGTQNCAALTDGTLEGLFKVSVSGT